MRPVLAGGQRRLADEYDAAQDRGEVRGANTGRSVSQAETPSFRDIGFSEKDIHEARLIRDAEVADPGVVRRTLSDARIGVLSMVGTPQAVRAA